jgi:hypothetical protein
MLAPSVDRPVDSRSPTMRLSRALYWYERHEALADWIDEQEHLAARSRAEDERLLAEHPDDPLILFRRR